MQLCTCAGVHLSNLVPGCWRYNRQKRQQLMYWVAETRHLQYTLHFFLAVHSQLPVSIAQQQWWKFLNKSTVHMQTCASIRSRTRNVLASMHVCRWATHKYTKTMFVLVSLSGGWLEKPDRCNPVSLSTSETWPMGCQRPLCRIMGPKCTVWCRGRAWTESRKWWHESGLSITFKMRWGTSRRWVQTNTTSSHAYRSICCLHKAVWVDVHNISLWIICMYTGTRFSGEGERTNVWAVRGNAAINAEAFRGNEGN